jgi:hypothetical protein
MYNLILRLRTPRKLPEDLDKRQRKLVNLTEELNKETNLNDGEFYCVNLASEYLKYNKSKINKIGWGFYNEREIELQFFGGFDKARLVDLLNKKGYKIIELNREINDCYDGYFISGNTGGGSTYNNLTEKEHLERIAIEKAHEDEDKYCDVKYQK